MMSRILLVPVHLWRNFNAMMLREILCKQRYVERER